MRIAKFLSSIGLCSRRKAEEKISNKEVFVNNELLTTPSFVVSAKDIITIDNQKFSLEDLKDKKTRLWLYYKKTGLVCSRSDNKGRNNIFDDIERRLKIRCISVGRLDINSEGLMLITNDGNLANKLTKPNSKIKRIYKVRVFGRGDLFLQNKNITKDGQTYHIYSLKPLSKEKAASNRKSNYWYEVILFEGKNREVRHIFEHYNMQVNRLIRTNYGKYSIINMRTSEIREVKIPKDL